MVWLCCDCNHFAGIPEQLPGQEQNTKLNLSCMLKNNRESIWDSAACCTQDAADPPDLSYPKYLLRPPTASPQRFVSFVAHPYLPKY